jgi:DNA (cytosine-5)-methyltransferase 1
MGAAVMRVADFYCGAGGFSEGFRQAGFNIIFAVDKWEPAINTFKANKPNCHVVQDDVIRISQLPDVEFHKLVPDTEVIIGSPPCVAFSNSNKSGNGDKALGIKLLKAYLRIVARKKNKPNSILRYWVLENVPNIRKYIQEHYSASDLGLDGNFTLTPMNESSGIYNAKYFGAPTNRKRFLCGEFPKPQTINVDANVMALRAVLDSLGEPCDGQKGIIQDCNYPELSLPSHELTDHHYLYMLQPFEWEISKRLKEDKGYMGKMSFPENIDNPARTVMATMSSSSRESMILAASQGGYRLPTVREAASMMSFPIDYRFYGKSKGIKHTLVGNSVPPKMSYSVAKAIALDANEPIPEKYIPIQHNVEIPFYNLNNVTFEPKVERPKRAVAKFKYHIPYMILDAYRVELTNYHSDFEKEKFKWTAEIHFSQGKNKAKVFRPMKIEKYIADDIKSKIALYITQMRPTLSSFNRFQKIYCMTDAERNEQKLVGPFELLKSVKTFLQDAVPIQEWHDSVVISRSYPHAPKALAIGYYLLREITKEMGGMSR